MLNVSPQPQPVNLEELAPEIRNGLSELLKGFDYARDLQCPIWDFSVEIERLLALGMTTSDLRWLVKRGLLAHAREATGPHDADRRFDFQMQNLAFSKSTCFALTASGLAMLGRDGDIALELGAGSSQAAAIEMPLRTLSAKQCEFVAGPPANARILPNWDRDTRTFLVGERVVKQFRVPSPNQEAVLDAFQEEGWPRCVDDPLPPVPDQQPKRRLRDTIKCLNLNQASRAIRFRGDGTGQRVFWELLIDVDAHPAVNNPPLRRAA